MSEPLPKRIVLWAAVSGYRSEKQEIDVPDDIKTEDELDEWACEAAAQMIESGWFPAAPAEKTEGGR